MEENTRSVNRMHKPDCHIGLPPAVDPIDPALGVRQFPHDRFEPSFDQNSAFGEGLKGPHSCN